MPADKTACELFVDAVTAFAAGDAAEAFVLAGKALEREPESLVYAQAVLYLEGTRGEASVYSSAEAFAAFVEGGGNVPLYQAVARSLKEIYAEYDSVHLLDVGVGHGRALLPALASSVVEISAVEPSADMLSATEQALAALGMPFHGYEMTAQEFISQPRGRWKVAQATFSLQSLEPAERLSVLQWLREHCDRLLLVEFDVPSFSSLLHPAHVRSVCERYEQGLAEYGDSRDLVAQGFLMPVMFGYFRADSARTNYEHSLERWVDQVQTAGFSTVATTPLYDYWWGPAHLIDARS